MQLIPSGDVPRWDVQRTFRYSPLAAVIVLSLFVACPVALVVLAQQGFLPFTLAELPSWAWFAAIPFILGELLILIALGRLFGGCFGPDGWIMKVTRNGLYLQFRSCFSRRAAGQTDRTVVYLPFSEIQSARRVTEKTPTISSEGRASTLMTQCLELRLRDVDTESLREAVARETARKPGENKRFALRFHHVPVRVPEPGVVRVEWHGGGMLTAIRDHVSIEQPHEAVQVDATAAGGDEAIIALLERGHKMDAIRMARKCHNFSLAEAKQFVEELTDTRVGGR